MLSRARPPTQKQIRATLETEVETLRREVSRLQNHSERLRLALTHIVGTDGNRRKGCQTCRDAAKLAYKGAKFPVEHSA